MRTLIVAATSREIAPLVAKFDGSSNADSRLHTYKRGSRHVDVLITGVGMVATAVWCARQLTQDDYDAALNLGVCGSFDSALAPGTVVHVVSDRLAELGAEDGDAFLTLDELQLPGDVHFVNATPMPNRVLAGLTTVRGVTVNTVHGRASSIAAVVQRFSPQVESMEGAAFLQACSVQGIPHAQVRAVSNIVERRNRARWKMTEAIDNLARVALEILDNA